MATAVGIDLGTTNSVIAAWQGGEPIVIPNAEGARTTPSVVAFTESGERLVGQLARRQSIMNPKGTIYSAKRFIGRRFDEISEEAKAVSFDVVPGPNGEARFNVRGKLYAPEEISAQVLRKLVEDASKFLGERVKEAVITVPAYFNDAQRNATKDAGRIAGLEVIRIINEPTSAALAYGFGQAQNERQVAVFDLGGGTFDFTVLHMFKGVFEVEATGGDSLLGGEDFDARIIDYLADPFQKKHGTDLRKDKMALQRLRDAAEKAKCELSSLKQVEMNLPFISASQQTGPLHLQATLSRDQREQMTADLVQRCVQVCERVLGEAKVHAAQLGDVLLVGGQTRMPKIQEEVRRLFGKEPAKNVNPDEAVALGAAIQGAMLLPEEQEMLLLDVTPHSLGIAIAGGFFQKIIAKNTTVPTSAHHVFTTVKDDQTSAKITVLQGESDIATENELLGEFMLTGLRAAPRGGVDIDVTFG